MSAGRPPRPAQQDTPPPTVPAPGAATRASAVRILAEVEAGRSFKAVLSRHLPQLGDSRDRALCEAICHAVLRRRAHYSAVIDQLMEKPLPAQARPVGLLLQVGLAQLEHLGLPEHAAVAATTEAARVLSFPRHVGLVNAVLRRYLRERAQLPALSLEHEAERAHPAWLLSMLRADWPQQAAQILSANLQQAPLWLRLYDLAQADVLDTALDAEGVERIERRGEALALRSAGDPSRLRGFAEGWFAVQDINVQAAVRALDVGPGQRVLDACAAPGGKAAQIAALGADLLALDSNERRLQRVAETLQRLRLAAELRCADAGEPAGWWDGRLFERILIDAPCSGTGVIRRQPDILLHRRADDIPTLVAQQARLLSALWPLLAPGGRLVYATCSVLKDENERQIEAFLATHDDAEPVPLDAGFGHPSGAGRQRLPGEADGDGFFIAALRHRG